MAAALALMAAFLFALAATLQQKGALNIAGVSLAKPMSLVRLAGQTHVAPRHSARCWSAISCRRPPSIAGASP